MTTELRLIVFDLGGVLVRVARDWAEACQFAGCRVLRDERFAASVGALSAQYQIGHLGTAEYFDAVSAASGEYYSALEVERIHQAWSREQFEGVEHVFDLLAAAGMDAAVLSNTNAAHWSRLAALCDGQPEYPIVLRAKYHIASHLLGVAKPDPQAFAAVTAVAAIAPEEVLFFDDALQNVAAARSVGWNAVHIDAGANTPEQILATLRRFGIVAP